MTEFYVLIMLVCQHVNGCDFAPPQEFATQAECHAAREAQYDPGKAICVRIGVEPNATD
jgi:hypothetical protein